MMPYAADDLGRPVFFISSMAMHTQNLQEDSRASLLITQPDVSGDPLGAGRLTLLGASHERSGVVDCLTFYQGPNWESWIVIPRAESSSSNPVTAGDISPSPGTTTAHSKFSRNSREMICH